MLLPLLLHKQNNKILIQRIQQFLSKNITTTEPKNSLKSLFFTVNNSTITTTARINSFGFSSIKDNTEKAQNNTYIPYSRSRQAIINKIYDLQHEITLQKSLVKDNSNNNENTIDSNNKQQKNTINININNNNSKQQQKQQQTIIKQDKLIQAFLELTEQSFSQHLDVMLRKTVQQQNGYQHNDYVDRHVLLMILSSMSNIQLVKKHLPAMYNSIHLLNKQELVLFYELVLSHKPEYIPKYIPVSQNLDDIETILLLLSQLYAPQLLIDWMKQIPVYRGKNVYMVSVGFFAIYEKMLDSEVFKNKRLIDRIIDRVITLSDQEDEETQAGLVILAFDSAQTSHFGVQFMLEMDLDFNELDPLKLQLLYLSVQRYLLSAQCEDMRQSLKKKKKFQIVEEDSTGSISKSSKVEYLNKRQENGEQIQQLEKYQFLSKQTEELIHLILALNWQQCVKLNILLEYWKLIPKLEQKDPWTKFSSQVVKHTSYNSTMQKMLDLEVEQVILILEGMEKMKLNRDKILHRCLVLLSQKLQVLSQQQLIRLSRVCVTYVRQCDDYLASLRLIIERRKFIFSDEQITELNEIYKRVLILFPVPLVK